MGKFRGLQAHLSEVQGQLESKTAECEPALEALSASQRALEEKEVEVGR